MYVPQAGSHIGPGGADLAGDRDEFRTELAFSESDISSLYLVAQGGIGGSYPCDVLGLLADRNPRALEGLPPPGLPSIVLSFARKCLGGLLTWQAVPDHALPEGAGRAGAQVGSGSFPRIEQA
jgi:hypothetical protein